MADTFDVLLVCTGNICRSPLAERALAGGFAQLAEEFGADWAPGAAVHVQSAGTAAHAGDDMSPETADLVRARGLDASGHIARQLTREETESSGLVLALTREHRRRVVSLSPRANGWTFALGEFARGVTHLADSGEWNAPADALANPAATLRSIVETAALRRGFVPPPADSRVDDVVDPYLLGPEVYARTGQQIDDAVGEIIDGLRRLLRAAA